MKQTTPTFVIKGLLAIEAVCVIIFLIFLYKPVLSFVASVFMPSSSVRISILCSTYPSDVGKNVEERLLIEGAQKWARETGNPPPSVDCKPMNTNEVYQFYKDTLISHSPDIDIYSIDNYMLSMLQTHFITLYPCSGQTPCIDNPAEINQHWRFIIDSSTLDDRGLVGIPWFIDVGLLFYREDWLQEYNESPPETWGQLANTARKIQREIGGANSEIWGFVWQGKPYEGLTCNALEWIYSFGVDKIIDNQPPFIINGDDPKVIEAIASAASWLKEEETQDGRRFSISPQNVLQYDENKSRDTFANGHAIFMRDWPLGWQIVNDAKSQVKVGVTILPKGENGEHKGTRGGWMLAVSRYSRHQKEAVELVRRLTDWREQKRRVLDGSLLPSIRKLYEDDDVMKLPIFRAIERSTGTTLMHLLDAGYSIERPWKVTGVRYNAFSAAFQHAVHKSLFVNGTVPTKEDITNNLKGLYCDLMRISYNGTWDHQIAEGAIPGQESCQ